MSGCGSTRGSSLILAQAAGAIAGRLTDSHILGQSRRAAANALCLSGSVRESLALHEQAIAAFESVRRRTRSWRAR